MTFLGGELIATRKRTRQLPYDPIACLHKQMRGVIHGRGFAQHLTDLRERPFLIYLTAATGKERFAALVALGICLNVVEAVMILAAMH